MWHLVGYSTLLLIIGIASYVGLQYFQEKRKNENAEKAASDSGLTPEERERMINEAMFMPTDEELIKLAYAASRHLVNRNADQSMCAPQGFFIGDWTDRLHIMYFEAMMGERGKRVHGKFYSAGMDTFMKRRDGLEKLVQKYRVVRNPNELHRNYRLAQEYFDPILLQLCARPNAERGKLSSTELEAFSEGLRLAYSLCSGMWRGLGEMIRFFAQEMATEDLLALPDSGKQTLTTFVSRTENKTDHKIVVLLNALAKTALARISRKCSFEDASDRPRVGKKEWDVMWRPPAKATSSTSTASQPSDGEKKQTSSKKA